MQFPSSSPQVITRSPRPTRPQGRLFSCDLRRDLIRVRHLGRFTLLEGPAALLLGNRVLGPIGDDVHLGEPADEYRIPKLRCDAQVLAASHESVGLGALNRLRDALGTKVVVDAHGL